MLKINVFDICRGVPMSRQLPVSCYVVGIALLGFLILALLSIVAIHLHEIPILERSQLLRTSAMCGAFGMLGSSMATVRKYYQVLITESAAKYAGRQVSESGWDFGWTFYYLTRPILGSVLGALAFVLVFIGFEILSATQTTPISNHGHMMLYAIALLAGYAVSQVLDRLTLVARQVFSPINVKKEQ